jgi:hypothetical protein
VFDRVNLSVYGGSNTVIVKGHMPLSDKFDEFTTSRNIWKWHGILRKKCTWRMADLRSYTDKRGALAVKREFYPYFGLIPWRSERFEDVYLLQYGRIGNMLWCQKDCSRRGQRPGVRGQREYTLLCGVRELP